MGVRVWGEELILIIVYYALKRRLNVSPAHTLRREKTRVSEMQYVYLFTGREGGGGDNYTHPIVGHSIVVAIAVAHIADAIVVAVELLAVGDERTVVSKARRLHARAGQGLVGDAVQVGVLHALASVPDVSDRALRGRGEVEQRVRLG